MSAWHGHRPHFSELVRDYIEGKAIPYCGPGEASAHATVNAMEHLRHMSQQDQASRPQELGGMRVTSRGIVFTG